MLNEGSKLEKPTVVSILKTVPSGIGFDIAKNHTGITIWNGESVEYYGFKLDEYDKSDYFGLYKMRRNLKRNIEEIVRGRHFEYCIVEDIYGGENYDTVRKLAEINTVPDEIIFDRTCTVGTFVRWNQPKWASAVRNIYKQKGKLKSKVETQGILEYLEDEFYMKNKDLSKSEKEDIFFEDICDSTAMLLGLVISVNMDLNLAKQVRVGISSIKMVYLEDELESYGARDDRIREEGFIGVELNYRNIEKSVIDLVNSHPNDVLCAYLPVDKLGNFGLKRKFKFYESGEGYLFFYKK